MPDKSEKAKRDAASDASTPAQVPVDLGGVRYSVKVYTADQIDEMLADLPSQELIEQHIANRDNPHEVTKAQVGLGNADNTSDKSKPLSDADIDALDRKVNVIEPWELVWYDGDEPHNVERLVYRLRVWVFSAFSKAWDVRDIGEGRWSASCDGGQHWVDGVISGTIQEPESVTFTVDDVDYEFEIISRSIISHIAATNNPHKVTGQQIGVLGSSGKIAANLVNTASIANKSVDSNKLGTGAVTAEKLSSGVKDSIGKNVNASVSVMSPKLIATQAGGIIVKGLDDNWWSIGIDANGDLYKTRVDPPAATTNIADLDEEPVSEPDEDEGENSNE